MFEFFATYALGVAILFNAERLYQQKYLAKEVARKIGHVSAGLIAISWAFFVSWNTIIIAELVVFLGALLFRRLKLLRGVYGVKRLSWGELFYSAGVIAVILLGAPRWIFVVALLHAALADTAAALVGEKYGSQGGYNVFGQQKSVMGSLAFFVVSATIIGGVFIFTPQHAGNVALLMFVPMVATLAENVGVYGSDNFVVPVAVALLLIR